MFLFFTKKKQLCECSSYSFAKKMLVFANCVQFSCSIKLRSQFVSINIDDLANFLRRFAFSCVIFFSFGLFLFFFLATIYSLLRPWMIRNNGNKWYNTFSDIKQAPFFLCIYTYLMRFVMLIVVVAAAAAFHSKCIICVSCVFVCLCIYE